MWESELAGKRLRGFQVESNGLRSDLFTLRIAYTHGSSIAG